MQRTAFRASEFLIFSASMCALEAQLLQRCPIVFFAGGSHACHDKTKAKPSIGRTALRVRPA